MSSRDGDNGLRADRPGRQVREGWGEARGACAQGEGRALRGADAGGGRAARLQGRPSAKGHKAEEPASGTLLSSSGDRQQEK